MKKLWSFVRWGLVMLISLFGWITAKFMFPILYPFREFITAGKFKPFWYYFDAEDGYYGNDKFLKHREKNFWTAYKWNALRNPAWNLQASLKPKDHFHKFLDLNGNKVRKCRLVSAKGWLFKDGFIADDYDMAVLKTTDGYGNYFDNFGDHFSKKHSIIGKNRFVWYKIDKRLYWRFSSAGKSKNFILNKLGDLIPKYKNKKGNWYYEIQIGTNDTRYTWRVKRRKLR